MRTEQIKLYKIDELSEEAKEKALNKCVEINLERGDWYEFIYEGFEEELQKAGLETKLNNAEWDLYKGRYFKFDKIYVKDWKRLLEQADCLKHLISLALDSEFDIDIAINGNEADVKINCDDESKQEEINSVEEKIGKDLSGFIERLAYNFWKQLNDGYSYSISDEAVTETLRINEYEFKENGDGW